MTVKIQVIIESEGSETTITDEVAGLQRGALSDETIGLTLAEAKELLASVQEKMVPYQTEEYIQQQRNCPECSKARSQKGQHEMVYRSLFGQLKLHSPRLYTCSCQPQSQRRFSPLAECLSERTAPELLYLQTKWAKLQSYGLTVDLIEEVLPINTNVATVYRERHQAAERTESEVGDEKYIYIDSCMRDWESLPPPDGPITVGIDGCYVQAGEGDNRQAGWFETIVGKSITEQGENKCCAFVPDLDQKPNRRLFELLKTQGLQLNLCFQSCTTSGVDGINSEGDTRLETTIRPSLSCRTGAIQFKLTVLL